MNKISKQKIFNFINSHYEREHLVLFTGSFSKKKGTKNSDIDLLIVTGNYYYPFITKVEFEGFDFHVKVVPSSKIWDLMISERAIDGPALCDMIANGIPIIDSNSHFSVLQSLANDILALGPFPMTVETERHLDISISKYLQVLARDIPSHEKVFVIGDLVECFTKRLLLNNGMWPQSVKKRHQHLEVAFPGLSERIFIAVQEFYNTGNTTKLFELVVNSVNVDDSVQYYHSKRVDESGSYNKFYLCISLIGCDTPSRFFEVVNYLLVSFEGKYNGYYMYLFEDGKNKNGSNHYLILTNPDFEKISNQLAKIRSTYSQANSKVSFVYPENLMGYRHEKLDEDISVIPIFLSISKLIKASVIDTNQPNKLNFLLIKFIIELFENPSFQWYDIEQVLYSCYKKWIAAAVDYTNTFTMDQTKLRKEWIDETYSKEVTNVLTSFAFSDYLNTNDSNIKAALETCLPIISAIRDSPKSHITHLKSQAEANLEYFLSIVFDAFLIPDRQKSYLYLLIFTYYKTVRQPEIKFS